MFTYVYICFFDHGLNLLLYLFLYVYIMLMNNNLLYSAIIVIIFKEFKCIYTIIIKFQVILNNKIVDLNFTPMHHAIAMFHWFNEVSQSGNFTFHVLKLLLKFVKKDVQLLETSSHVEHVHFALFWLQSEEKNRTVFSSFLPTGVLYLHKTISIM